MSMLAHSLLFVESKHRSINVANTLALPCRSETINSREVLTSDAVAVNGKVTVISRLVVGHRVNFGKLRSHAGSLHS